MGIDITHLESDKAPPGYHEGIYNKDPNSWGIIAKQVDIEIQKLERTHPVELRHKREEMGEDELRVRVHQQLAMEYESNSHLLRIWEHEQGLVAGALSRSSGMQL